MTTRGEGCGKKISNLILGLDMTESAITYQVVNIMYMNLDLFRTVMKHRIRNNLNSAGVVHKKIHWRRTLDAKVRQEASQPDKLGTNIRHCTILSFGGRLGKLAAETPKKRTGRRVFKETRHPIYRGVRSRKGNKWVCELREPNTGARVWLGTYTDPEMAARAHDVAALAFRGKSACLNFADSAWRLPVPASTDPNDIRRAAAEAAEMFRPGQETALVEDQEQECSSSTAPAGDHVYMSNYAAVEEELEMPRLLSDMAEGLLLSPPRPAAAAASTDTWNYYQGNSCNNDEAYAAEYDWSLWN